MAGRLEERGGIALALSLSELTKLKDGLVKAKLSGVREVRDQNGETITYKSDAEMAAALSHVERAITQFSKTQPSTIVFATSKGL